MEQWRVIDDFPTYEVSDHGQVANRSTGRILKLTKSPDTGLWWVGLRKNLQQHTRSIHRLVAHTFLYPPPQGCVPVHLDGDKDNNHADNLDWKTLSQARELTLERQKTEPTDGRSVRWIEADIVYPNALQAAREIGGFERYILLAASSGGSSAYKRGHWEFVY